MPRTPQIPGWEGTVGPFPGQYGSPHVYARDIHSGAGNCVCGQHLRHALHVQAAPGVPLPPDRPIALSPWPACPNTPPCQHPDMFHDYGGEDQPPTCCVGDCPCP